MANLFVTSDTHFQHQNIFKFEPGRPGKDLDEHDEILIQNWNSVVKEGDKVWHLGDVYFGADQTARQKLLRLNGKKYLCLGNHDRGINIAYMKVFKDICVWKIFDGILCTHVPVDRTVLTEGRFTHGKGWYNVHGHTHSMGSPEGPYRCVSVEMTNYHPISLEELRDQEKKHTEGIEEKASGEASL
jgi:calcineurin-like phosphoesterase family protein